jgi:hypothetical protein
MCDVHPEATERGEIRRIKTPDACDFFDPLSCFRAPATAFKSSSRAV